MVDFLANYGYWGLFLGALLAGSILPFSSEILLSGLLLAGANPVLCLVSATAGNTLGGMTCFWLGKLGNFYMLFTFKNLDETCFYNGSYFKLKNFSSSS